MSIQEIKRALSSIFQGILKNIVSLGNDSDLSNELKVVKVGNIATGIELSKTKTKLSGNIDINSTSDLRIKSTNSLILDTNLATSVGVLFKNNGSRYAMFDYHHTATHFTLFENGGASTSDKLNIKVGENGETTFQTVDLAGAAGHIKLEPDGSLLIKEAASAGANVADYGQLWIKSNTPNELWFTNDAGNDIPISLQPFIKTAQFQDDIGTTRHWIPFNNLAEQSSSGVENVGFIAPFNLALQKVIIKCSEDISGADFEVSIWRRDDGDDTAFSHTSGNHHVHVTGGAAHTNATADFTGTVHLGNNTSGGSNSVSAGQFVNLSIKADSDQTSSSAEFWVTCYFLADMVTTI